MSRLYNGSRRRPETINKIIMKEYMIQIGELSDGRIIEVPDLLIYGIPIFIIVTIFSLSNKEKKNG
tara:strand:- start:405 stop:602 length:198 start_codon:yes stop_codon:yes gene_type:complete